MPRYVFYSENKKAQAYTLDLEEIKVKYLEYLKSKDPEWVVYYADFTVTSFINDPDGLNSTASRETVHELLDPLMTVRHTLPIYK